MASIMTRSSPVRTSVPCSTSTCTAQHSTAHVQQQQQSRLRKCEPDNCRRRVACNVNRSAHAVSALTRFNASTRCSRNLVSMQTIRLTTQHTLRPTTCAHVTWYTATSCLKKQHGYSPLHCPPTCTRCPVMGDLTTLLLSEALGEGMYWDSAAAAGDSM
jgi:hypothetical protein